MNEQVIERMREVAAAVEDLPEGLRAEAFSMMRGYILGSPGGSEGSGDGGRQLGDEGTDKEVFFAGLDPDRPADGVMSIAAFHYSQYGTAAFDLDYIRTLANEVGLVIPARIDMTLKGAKRGGKPLFRTIGRGLYSPTVNGEKVLKEEFGVAKGRQAAPSRAGSDGL